RDDAVGAAVERGRRHRQRRGEALAQLGALREPVAAGEAADVRGAGAAEGARERDHLAHVLGGATCDFARVDAAEAPADEADLPAVARDERSEALAEAVDDLRRGTEVPAEAPAVHVVAATAEIPAQRLRRAV